MEVGFTSQIHLIYLNFLGWLYLALPGSKGPVFSAAVLRTQNLMRRKGHVIPETNLADVGSLQQNPCNQSVKLHTPVGYNKLVTLSSLQIS